MSRERFESNVLFSEQEIKGNCEICIQYIYSGEELSEYVEYYLDSTTKKAKELLNSEDLDLMVKIYDDKGNVINTFYDKKIDYNLLYEKCSINCYYITISVEYTRGGLAEGVLTESLFF